LRVYFADTSAIGKRYIAEIGSLWIKTLLQYPIFISQLTVIEILAMFARRYREQAVSQHDFTQIRDDFLFHARREYLVIKLDTPVIRQAQKVVLQYPIRSLDAIQLASVRLVRKEFGVNPIFLSGDKAFLKLASADGFTTDDPNQHP
jgi:hypothetical protein